MIFDDEQQPDLVKVVTLEAMVILLMRRLGISAVTFPPADLRGARLRELDLIPHAGGAVSVGVGAER